jgi:hypothetical protein
MAVSVYALGRVIISSITKARKRGFLHLRNLFDLDWIMNQKPLIIFIKW